MIIVLINAAICQRFVALLELRKLVSSCLDLSFGTFPSLTFLTSVHGRTDFTVTGVAI